MNTVLIVRRYVLPLLAVPSNSRGGAGIDSKLAHHHLHCSTAATFPPTQNAPEGYVRPIVTDLKGLINCYLIDLIRLL